MRDAETQPAGVRKRDETPVAFKYSQSDAVSMPAQACVTYPHASKWNAPMLLRILDFTVLMGC